MYRQNKRVREKTKGIGNGWLEVSDITSRGVTPSTEEMLGLMNHMHISYGRKSKNILVRSQLSRALRSEMFQVTGEPSKYAPM